MQEFQEDLYAILGVEEGATPDEIRKSYLKLAKKLHPDRFPNDPEKRAAAQQEFAKVTKAHDVLADARQRDEYDSLRKLAKVRGGDVAAAAAEVAEAAKPSETQTKLDKDAWASKHNDRAKDLLKRKKFGDAETAVKEALRLNPQNASYHATLAEIHMARGWKTLALTSVNQALKLDPKNYEAKDVELKLKTASRSTGENVKPTAAQAGASGKKGLLDQIKDLLNKKM